MRLSAVLLFFFLPGILPAQDAPKYRCLAPFVWSIDDSKPPASLFEVFLKGPFDRFETGASSGEELLALGWESANSGNVDLAMILFRQAWEDAGSGDALVSMALHSMEVPAVAKLMAKEAIEKCSPSSWRGLAQELSKKGVMSAGGLEEWCLRNPQEKRVSLFVLRRVLENSKREGLAPGWAVAASMVLSGEEKKNEWMTLRLAEESGIFPYRRELQMIADRNPSLLPIALRISMAKGDLGSAVDFLGRIEDPAEEVFLLGAELARRLDQKDAAEGWLRAWRQSPAFSKEEREARSREEEKIRERWSGSPGSGPGDLDAFLRNNPGHLRAKVSRIAADFEMGNVRDALFSADNDLRSQVLGSDSKAELLAQLEKIAAKGKWRPGWEMRGKGVEMPLPRGIKTQRIRTKVEVTGLDGEPLHLLENGAGNRGKLILFYTGVGCPACQVQLQAFRGKTDRWNQLGLEIVAVSAQGAKEVSEGLKKSGQEFPFIFAGDSELVAFQTLGIYDSFEEYPMHGVVVLDGEGQVRWSIRSYQPFTEVDFLADELSALFSKD